MPRYDKYEPFAGGFRAALADDFAYTGGKPDKEHADLGKMFTVGLTTTGRVTRTTANMNGGVWGLLILTKPRAAGEIVDVMTDGEIVEFTDSAGAAATPGTNYYAATDGGYNATAPTVGVNAMKIGTTVEAARLVVRLDQVQGE